MVQPSEMIDFVGVLPTPFVIIEGLVCDDFNARVAVRVLSAGFDDGKKLTHFILKIRIV